MEIVWKSNFHTNCHFHTVDIVWKYYGYGIEILHIVCKYYGYSTEILWIQYGNTTDIVLKHYGYSMETLWIQYGVTMDIVWKYCIQYEILWKQYRYSMEILWIQYENIAYNMDYGNIVCICMHILQIVCTIYLITK